MCISMFPLQIGEDSVKLIQSKLTAALAALFAVTDSHQLAAFSHALRSLHD